jgi:DNA-nicking Smr family endonuclease
MSGKDQGEISDLEEAFFREVLKDVRPLERRLAPPARPPKRFKPPENAPRPAATLAPKAPVHTDAKAPVIGGHREAHMRKGRLEPEAKLDLHGYRQEAAYQALERFLQRARGLGQRVVLVVTGKGGVLRDLLPKWLGEYEFRELVAGISTAHIKHGGDGAFYVAIKRQRQK